MRLTTITGFFVLCLIWISLTGCEGRFSNDQESMQQVSLALDWFPNANHAGLFLAIEKGYFTEEGLEVSAYTPEDPASILQTVGTGADDFGINYQPDLLLARDRGVPVLSVASIVQGPLNSKNAHYKKNKNVVQQQRHLYEFYCSLCQLQSQSQ